MAYKTTFRLHLAVLLTKTTKFFCYFLYIEKLHLEKGIKRYEKMRTKMVARIFPFTHFFRGLSLSVCLLFSPGVTLESTFHKNAKLFQNVSTLKYVCTGK